MWDVGMKVVCVDDSPCRLSGQCTGLVLDKIYVITRIIKARDSDKIGFAINGVRDDIGKIFTKPNGVKVESIGFHPDRFRKVLPDKHEGCSEAFKQLIKGTVDA